MNCPNCPECGKPIPEEIIRAWFASRGGSAGRGKAKARTSAQARAAALAGVRARRRKARELERLADAVLRKKKPVSG